MQYTLARLQSKRISEVYQRYVTDALQIISENMASRPGDKYLKTRYTDIIKPQKKKKKDNRTGEQIAADMAKILAGKGGES